MNTPSVLPPQVAVKFSVLDRHIAWLRQHHSQSAGAARNLRTSARAQDSEILADQKRKSADAAAVNAAHYHEIAELLTQLQTARRVLANHEGAINNGIQRAGPSMPARTRFIETIDRLLNWRD